MQKHESSDSNKIVIYKASAGSGKTHKITEQYLLLLLNPQTPFVYKSILAVTFTNKATDEMKSRVVDELARLGKGEESPYMEILENTYNAHEDQIRSWAKSTLIKILHDYSSFTISTIDKFFQQTMRAFTRELGIDGNYGIELDSDKVLLESIDNLLADLEKQNNGLLLSWLVRFTEEKVEEGNNWSIKQDIHKLAKEIFKEDFKANREFIQADINNKELLESYKKTLAELIFSYENRLQAIGQQTVLLIEERGLTLDSFKNGSRSQFFFFLKLANKESFDPKPSFYGLRNDIDAWYTKSTSAEIKGKISAIYPILNKMICMVLDIIDNDVIAYNTAKEINRYFFTLGILGDIDNEVRSYSATNNTLLISDTTELLNRIIDGSDTPFIYEKIGQYINHYMIDEFQDTSGMQWQNFKPLLKDSLAHNHKNFIVGDVKQSIYRWRNSDWNLLNTQVDQDFGKASTIHETLHTNWRSCPNIIYFNNTVFSSGSQMMQDIFNQTHLDNKFFEKYQTKITHVYDDVIQDVPENKLENTGNIKLQFINTATVSDWKQSVLESLPKDIESLQDKGLELKDIAILVRTKKEGVTIANYLLEYKKQNINSKYKYDIISDEALYINNSQSIKLIIALLKYLQNPDNVPLKSMAICEYLKFKENLQDEEALVKYFSENYEFSEEMNEQLEKIKRLSLYEMIESIIALFISSINSKEYVYMQTFLDYVLEYTTKYSADLTLFLNWWNETGVTKTIFTPESQNAIKILTIHKSKGLGFEAVLIPFCNWSIDHSNSLSDVILWCKPQIAPFNQLHILPVRYSKKLVNTYFFQEYFEEKMHVFIDNLNTLYVAFTRAKKFLIAYAPLDLKKEVNDMSSLLYKIATNPKISEKQNCIDLQSFFNEEELLLEIGNEYQFPKQTGSRMNELLMPHFQSVPFENRLKLQLKNKYFFDSRGQRDYGNLMHEILSKVIVAEDLERVLKQFLLLGEITSSEKEEIEKLLNSFLAKKTVKKWFTNYYKILNEVQIFSPGGIQIRPDRVMVKGTTAIVIDYKFGILENPKYEKQVSFYISQIKKIGYTDIKGYICYVSLDKIIKL